VPPISMTSTPLRPACFARASAFRPVEAPAAHVPTDAPPVVKSLLARLKSA